MILRDHECVGCGFVLEDLVPGGAPLGVSRAEPCPECGGAMVSVLSGGHPTRMHDFATRDAELKRRSFEHTQKELKREPERWGFQAYAEPRGWNRRTPKRERSA